MALAEDARSGATGRASGTGGAAPTTPKGDGSRDNATLVGPLPRLPSMGPGSGGGGGGGWGTMDIDTYPTRELVLLLYAAAEKQPTRTRAVVLEHAYRCAPGVATCLVCKYGSDGQVQRWTDV
jgi:hypothetical protein